MNLDKLFTLYHIFPRDFPQPNLTEKTSPQGVPIPRNSPRLPSAKFPPDSLEYRESVESVKFLGDSLRSTQQILRDIPFINKFSYS